MTNRQIISKVLNENQKNGLLMGNCEDVLAEIPDESKDKTGFPEPIVQWNLC